MEAVVTGDLTRPAAGGGQTPRKGAFTRSRITRVVERVVVL